MNIQADYSNKLKISHLVIRKNAVTVKQTKTKLKADQAKLEWSLASLSPVTLQS